MVDVSYEVKLLDEMLRKISLLVSVEEDIKSSGEIALLSDTACELANTIKYLKSDFVYNNEEQED